MSPKISFEVKKMLPQHVPTNGRKGCSNRVKIMVLFVLVFCAVHIVMSSMWPITETDSKENAFDIRIKNNAEIESEISTAAENISKKR